MHIKFLCASCAVTTKFEFGLWLVQMFDTGLRNTDECRRTRGRSNEAISFNKVKVLPQQNNPKTTAMKNLGEMEERDGEKHKVQRRMFDQRKNNRLVGKGRKMG